MQYTTGVGAEIGGGASVTFGYGFNSHVGAFVQWSADKYRAEGREASTLRAFDLGVRYRLRDSSQRFRPFLDAGIGKRSQTDRQGVLCGCLTKMRGKELLAGVGFEQFFTRRASFTALLQLASTKYDEQGLVIGGFTPSDASRRTVRASVGTTLYFRRLSEAERADGMARDSANEAATLAVDAAPPVLSRERGVFVQVGLEPTVLSSDDGGDSNSGAGAAVRVGYRIASGVSVFGEFARGAIFEGSEHAILDHLQAGLRFNTAARRRVIPYAEVAAGRRALTNNDFRICDPTCVELDFSQTGRVVSLGGGLVLGGASRVTTDLGLRLSVGDFTDFRINGQLAPPGVPPEPATTLRMHIGLTVR